MKNTKTVWLTHRMMQAFNLSNTVTGPSQVEFIIKANSPRDPDNATTGSLPAVGFDYYAGIYTKYRCTESTQEVKFIASGQNGFANGVALIVHDLAHADETNGVWGVAGAGNVAATGGFLLSTLKAGATHRLVSSGAGTPTRLFRRYNSRAAFGVTPTTGADECLVTEDPTRTALYKVLVANQGFEASVPMATTVPQMTGTVMITTRYKVKFLSPKDLTVLM